jgi:hypothetical protein
LGAKLGHNLSDQPGPLHRSSIDAHFVGTRTKHTPSVFESSNTTTDRERDVNLCGDAVDHFDRGCTVIARCSDVKKNQLVGALKVVAGCQFDWISGVAQVDKIGALHDPAISHVKAWNNARHLHLLASCA